MLPEPLPFLPGAFVNVFVEQEGKRCRRAYTISGSQGSEIVLSIRNGSADGMSRLFFEEGAKSLPVSIMGPLGLNTIDKITRPRVFLCAFGIGVSSVKGLAEALLARPSLTELWIITGSKTEEEILYKEYFESLAQKDSRVRLRFVLSRPTDPHYPYTGYLQDYITDLDFTDATAYLCGHGDACLSLQTAIAQRAPDTEFLVESFDS
jgi:NAD(P)H-flavin reductase